MISNATIAKYNLRPKDLREIFTADKRDKNVNKLNQLMADRIKDWRLRNLSDYRIWAAVDMAFDAPLSQITPTILRSITDSCHSAEDILTALRGWGLSEDTLFTKTQIEGTDRYRYELNQQVFSDVFLPFVRSYLMVRLSKIYNDRNLTPLFEFPPREFTAENRITCRILTEIVESVAINFGYSATLRSFIQNALMYSVALKFPVESWTEELGEEDDEEVVLKEGVRYVTPHVSRIGYDMTYPLDTLNTGTGCSFALYWGVKKWGEIMMDQTLWNRDKVPYGTNWLDPSLEYHNYFTEVMPCALQFPVPRETRKNDREAMVNRYTKSDFDRAFFQTVYFMELVPRDWNLSDYPYKVWMRFVIGGDDTVMYAEVCNGRPVDYIGYDADSGRGRNPSLALEILPFQDLASNAISQFLLTIKRNLLNFVFYDTDIVDPEQIQTLNRNKNRQFGGINFVGASSLKMDRLGAAVDAAFKQVNFQYADTNQCLSGLNTIIAMLERVLVISAQEIGGSASHQQSKKEVELANANTSNRVAYTASFVDEGIEAWKRSLAESIICNMSGKEVMASIPTDIPELETNLKKLGFEYVDGPPRTGQSHVMVKGTLQKLKLIQLVSRRSDASRQSDTATAQVMFQTLQTIANSQLLGQAVDVSSIVEMLEQAAKLAGADEDFKIRLNNDAIMAGQLQKLVQQIQQQIAAQGKQIMDAVEKEAVEPAAQAIGQIQHELAADKQQIAAQMAELEKTIAMLAEKLNHVSNVAPPPAPPLMPAAPPAPIVPPLPQPV